MTREEWDKLTPDEQWKAYNKLAAQQGIFTSTARFTATIDARGILNPLPDNPVHWEPPIDRNYKK